MHIVMVLTKVMHTRHILRGLKFWGGFVDEDRRLGVTTLCWQVVTDEREEFATSVFPVVQEEWYVARCVFLYSISILLTIHPVALYMQSYRQLGVWHNSWLMEHTISCMFRLLLCRLQAVHSYEWERERLTNYMRNIIVIIIIIIIINCNWVVIRWQWLFYMYTKYEIVC